MSTRGKENAADRLKGLFLKACHLVRRKREQEEAFRQALEEMGPEGRADVFVYSEYEELVFRLLKLMLGLKEEDKTFDTWFYDWNVGKDFEPGDYTENDEEIDLSTPCDFYEHFMEAAGKKEEK